MKPECECEPYVVIWLIALHYHLTKILKNHYLFDSMLTLGNSLTIILHITEISLIHKISAIQPVVYVGQIQIKVIMSGYQRDYLSLHIDDVI